MRWTILVPCICLLSTLSCGPRNESAPSPATAVLATTPAPVAKTAQLPTIRFLIIKNGILDQALADKRLPALVINGQTPSKIDVTKVFPVDELEPDMNPGTYMSYVFPATVGKSWKFADAAIITEQPLPVTGQFKLTDIKKVVIVALTGSAEKKGGLLRFSDDGYQLFSASLDSAWTGKIENNAPGDPADPFEK